jgi:hypothetical protein
MNGWNLSCVISMYVSSFLPILSLVSFFVLLLKKKETRERIGRKEKEKEKILSVGNFRTWKREEEKI